MSRCVTQVGALCITAPANCFDQFDSVNYKRALANEPLGDCWCRRPDVNPHAARLRFSNSVNYNTLSSMEYIPSSIRLAFESATFHLVRSTSCLGTSTECPGRAEVSTPCQIARHRHTSSWPPLSKSRARKPRCPVALRERL